MPRPTAWWLIIVSTFLLFVAVNIQAGWLFVLDFVLIAFIFSAWLLPVLWAGGKIGVERYAPRVFEGETVEVLLRVTNASFLARHFLLLEDLFPAADPAKQVTLFLPFLPRGKTVELHYKAKAERRGVYPPDNLIFRSLGPAGLFEWKRRLPGKGSLVVYPTPKDFPFSFEEVLPAPQPGEKGIQFGKGAGEEFLGIREYESGDSLRTVHWPSSAKAGKLMIRDMTRTHPALFTLFLDCEGKWKGRPFEQCVKLVVFAVEEILRQGHWLRIFQTGDAELKDWWGSLNWLASVEANEKHPLCRQVEFHLPVLLKQRQLLFFTVAPSAFLPESWKFVNALQEGFVQVTFVFLQPKQAAAGAPAGHLKNWLRSKGIDSIFVLED